MTGTAARVVATVPGETGALTRALASGAEWLWFLAAGARPRDDALERLLAAAEPEHAAPATVLAGVLVDDHGDMLDDGFQPAPRIDSADAVRLVHQRLLPLRSAGFGNCLVAQATFSRHGIPDERRFGAFAAEEWTARVLRTEPGYIVPASVVVVPGDPAAAGRADLLATIRMLRTGTWTRNDAARGLWRAVSRPAGRSRGR
jgi:hypothetical protein